MISVFRGDQAFFHDKDLGPSSDGTIKKLWKVLARFPEVEVPSRFRDTDSLIPDLKERSILTEKHFVEMRFPHITPARLFVDGP